MGLLEEAQQEQAGRRRGDECGVGRLLRRVSDEERLEIQALLDDDDLTSPVITTVLQRHGYDVKYQAVQRHRRERGRANACQCPR